MRTITVLLLVLILRKCESVCSPKYGDAPCTFVPAQPGHVPTCARPGSTFCEHPTHYPGRIIHELIDKLSFDYSSLFNDESPEEFKAYFIPSEVRRGPKPVYGPPNGIHDLYQSEPIFIPKPTRPVAYEPTSYIPQSTNFSGYPYSTPLNTATLDLPNNQLYNYNVAYKNPESPDVQHYTYSIPSNVQQPQYHTHDWHKRYARDLNKHQSLLPKLKERSMKRSALVKESLKMYTNGTKDLQRTKRQNPLTSLELCEIRSQYIMPRAALNNKGNWMYVVNMPNVDTKYTQLVKSETCVSQQCNGLCSLPSGYTSRCEQKYAQKRLVALEGSGDQLYSDIFWFPSCCVCTITN